MQKCLAGNLSNAVARNHAKAAATVASKNDSVQSYVPMQANRNICKVSHKTLGKGVNLVLSLTMKRLELRQITSFWGFWY